MLKTFKYLLLLPVMVVAGWQAVHAAEEPVKGEHYQAIDGAKGINKPQVLEFFSYRCPHCYSMENFLHGWLQRKPDTIEFARVPVPDSPVFMRAYYTAELLGVLDKVHPLIFDAIHGKKQVIRNQQQIRAIFEQGGVSGEEFDGAYNSFAVDGKVRMAEQMARKFRITSWPTFVVNQKYVTGGHLAKSYPMLEKVLTDVPLQD